MDNPSVALIGDKLGASRALIDSTWIAEAVARSGFGLPRAKTC
jgi:hypothetical protein